MSDEEFELIRAAVNNNPHLSYWERNTDKSAWEQALIEDSILQGSSRWREASLDDRYREVVRRVLEVMPEAGLAEGVQNNAPHSFIDYTYW